LADAIRLGTPAEIAAAVKSLTMEEDRRLRVLMGTLYRHLFQERNFRGFRSRNERDKAYQEFKDIRDALTDIDWAAFVLMLFDNSDLFASQKRLPVITELLLFLSKYGMGKIENSHMVQVVKAIQLWLDYEPGTPSSQKEIFLSQAQAFWDAVYALSTPETIDPEHYVGSYFEEKSAEIDREKEQQYLVRRALLQRRQYLAPEEEQEQPEEEGSLEEFGPAEPVYDAYHYRRSIQERV